MLSVQFWKSWPSVYQRLLLITSMIFIAALAAALFAFARNPEPSFSWQQLQELRQEEIPAYSFEVGGFDLTVTADNYIVFERWDPNSFRINITATDVYLAFFALAFTMLLAIVTTLPRFWFYIGAGTVVFIIPAFQLETLQLFGLQNKLPTIVLIAIVLGIGLYYQFINKAASFLHRIVILSLTCLLVGWVLMTFSNVPQPLRYFATNTLPASIVLLLIFVIMVSHEIMAAFVTLVGKGTRNSKSLRHYLFISGVYLINLWMAYWTRIGWIDWGFTLYPFVLLAVSGVLAIWGIRQRQPQYDSITDADPFGVYFIVALATMAFATFGYFLATANDVAVLVLNDLILYANIGYSMIFLTYVASNFLGMLARNYPVYKVLYKPTVMPYFSFRMAGLIFTLAFVFYNGWIAPVNRITSSYYTALGDLFHTEGNKTLSLGYYKRAWLYAPYNQHASTALAQIEAERGGSLKEREYLKDANSYKPTAFTLLNEANAIGRLGNSLDEILVLQKAHALLPESGVISNNLGLTFERLAVLDSAYLYFSQAQNDPKSRNSGEMNLLGLMANHNLNVNPDSIYRLVESKEPRVRGNALAFANRKGKLIETSITLPTDSTLNLFQATEIGNFLTNHVTKTDTAFLKHCIELAMRKENESVRNIILVPAARACYATGQVNRAFQIIQNVIFSGGSPGKHNTTLALWSLDQGKPEAALSYLEYALNQSTRQSGLVNALTLAESGKIDDAIVAWDTLGKTQDTTIQVMAESMKRVLGGPVGWYKNFSEKEKYQFLRYRVPLTDSIQFTTLVSQIEDEDLRAKAILDRSKMWFAQDETEKAARLFQTMQGLHLTDNKLFIAIKYFELHLFAAQGQWTLLQEQINKGILFGPYRETDHVYYEAMKLNASGDTLAAARHFSWLAENNSFFDEGVVAAAEFFEGRDRQKAYSILAEALQVNPVSVRILKKYILIALASGYDEYAGSALATLQRQISQGAFQQYALKNRLPKVPRQ